MNWIKVEDQLPEKHKEVLCYRESDGIIISYLSWILDDEPIWCDEVSDYTHWMPLPEKPSE